MADLQVTCVNKPDRSSSHESISRLGGYGWDWSRLQVVQMIREQTNTFYTLVGGRRANVYVVDGPHGPYVRTWADGYWKDNLLALNECYR